MKPDIFHILLCTSYFTFPVYYIYQKRMAEIHRPTWTCAQISVRAKCSKTSGPAQNRTENCTGSNSNFEGGLHTAPAPEYWNKGGHGQFWGAHGECVERVPIMEVWGQSPAGSRGPLKLKVF